MLVAYGWQAVAQVWAVGIAIMGVVFWFSPTTIRCSSRAARAAKSRAAPGSSSSRSRTSRSGASALYYFFVFGAFVALSLWLPRYLIGVYGLDIKTAGMIGAAFSFPASVFRAYGGHLSDRYGARRVMYWTFLVSVVCTFVLSYPPTDYIVRRHQRAASPSISKWASCRSP